MKNLAISVAFCAASVSQASNLKLVISGFKSDKGVARVSIFNSPEGFPRDAMKAVSLQVLLIEGGRAYLELPKLPAASYAVAAFHDENNNGKMDTNMVGFPKEAYGFSRDARGRFGPPSFADAAFVTSDEETTQQFRVE